MARLLLYGRVGNMTENCPPNCDTPDLANSTPESTPGSTPESIPGSAPGSVPKSADEKSPSESGRLVYLETFGCQMNVLDSQLIHSQLHGLGYQFVEDWQEANVILYNTCSVREHAEQKVYSRVALSATIRKPIPRWSLA